MTRTQYFTATSIDGYIADADNSLEWLFEADGSGDTGSGSAGSDGGEGGEGGGSDSETRFARFIANVGAMAMGATTYEWVLEHEKLLEHPEKWQAFYGDTPGWVFTHRSLPEIPGVTLHFVRDDVVPVHEAMTAAAGGRNIWLVGGGDLVGQFADRGLLDEILISVAPVTLGSGAPLLPRRLTARSLSLTGAETADGFAHLTYRVTHQP